jgi:TatD DNase family protein
VELFDSHLHLTDEQFAEDREAVIRAARASGVARMVTISSSPEDAAAALAIARREEGIWSSAGLHPHEAARFSASTVTEIEVLAAEAEVVAIGEAGLDFFYDTAPRTRQIECFEAQLDLASRLELPIIVHSREADAEMAMILRQHGPDVRGVLHCFTGGDSLLEAGLDAGWFVSFSGIITFRNFDGAGQVRRVPEDRLLIETDSPYLAPVPRRGKRNEPANLVHTCQALAGIRGVSAGQAAELTSRNARAFYRLSQAI